MKSTRPKVKVCGVTRLEDALALEALGVDYLGFNFYAGSKRFIEPARAAAIVSALKRAEPVGVFVNADAAEIASAVSWSGVRWAQLHGEEPWEVLEAVSLPVIKAVPHDRLGDWGGLKPEWERRSGRPRYFLVDTRAGNEFGGSGKSFDWSLLKTNPPPVPFFLAGGIGPENLADAVAACDPFAVDLNSKVESAPGIKDVGLVKRCLEILGR